MHQEPEMIYENEAASDDDELRTADGQTRRFQQADFAWMVGCGWRFCRFRVVRVPGEPCIGDCRFGSVILP